MSSATPGGSPPQQELLEAVRARYRAASMSDRTKILDEFAAVTGYHRKHAIRVLGSEALQERRKGVGAAIRRSIPVRTFSDWRDPPPGFFEVDMVEHCGGVKSGGISFTVWC